MAYKKILTYKEQACATCGQLIAVFATPLWRHFFRVLICGYIYYWSFFFLLFAGRCEPLSIPVCSGLHYNMTLVPNTFNHPTQQEAASNIHPLFQYSPYGDSPWNDCSPELPLFVCSLHAPPCSVPRKPCRELCERVRKSCLLQLQKHGYSWPENMACDKFPNAENEADCIGASQKYVPSTTVPIPREGC